MDPYKKAIITFIGTAYSAYVVTEIVAANQRKKRSEKWWNDLRARNAQKLTQ